MATVKVNGLASISGEIREQRDGAWTARIEVDDETSKITGPVSIVIGSATFVGTVVEGAVFSGRYVAKVVGGTGGLERELDAKFYHASNHGTVLADALREAGEALDPSESDASVSATALARWQRTKGKARLAMSAVARDVGGFWRVSRAGLVVLRKSESWTPVKFDFVSLDNDPSDGTIELAPEDSPEARPGVTVGEHKAASVVTTWDGGGLRQVVTVEAADGRARGAAGAFAAAIKKASESAVNYSLSYPAKIIQQDPDGTVHLLPTDDRMRGTGATKIPLTYGLPGCSAKVAPGTFARLYFDCGDPKQSACTSWDEDANALELAFRAAAIKLSASGAPTQSYVKGEAWLLYFDGVVAAISTTIGGVPVAGTALKAALDTAINTTLLPLRALVLSQIIKGE